MSFAKKTFSVLIRDSILFFSTIVTSVLLARALGPIALGIWVAINMIPSYAEMFGRIQADAASVYYLGKGRFSISAVSRALNWISIITSLSIIMPILIFYDQLMMILLKDKADEFYTLGYLILLQLPLNFLYLNYMYLHIHREDVKSLNIMILTRALLSSFFILSSLYIFNFGLFGAVMGSILAITIALILSIIRLGKLDVMPDDKTTGIYKNLVTYGFKLYLGNISSYFILYLGQLLVAVFLLPAQVAFYSMAQQLSQYIEKISNAMGTFLFPRVTKESTPEEASTFTAQAYRTACVIIIPMAIFILFVIKPVVLILYGNEFQPIVNIFYIIFPGIVAMSIVSTLTLFFRATGRADLLPKVLILPIFLQFGIGYFLVPEFGASGAAYGLSISLISVSITYTIIFLKTNRLSFFKTLFIRKTDIVIVYNFLLSVVLSIINFGRSREKKF